MDKRQSLLLGLLAALVVGLYLLSVGLGSGGGTADPRRSGGIEALDGGLSNLPGLGRSLSAGDVDADCFDGMSFRVGTGSACSFIVPEGVDRLVLEPQHSTCRVVVGEQDGLGEQSLDGTDVDDEGNLRVGLTGDGVDVRISSGSDDPCIVRLG